MREQMEQMSLFDFMVVPSENKITSGKNYNKEFVKLDDQIIERLTTYKLDDYCRKNVFQKIVVCKCKASLWFLEAWFGKNRVVFQTREGTRSEAEYTTRKSTKKRL